mgnify:CR=1 FL=1
MLCDHSGNYGRLERGLTEQGSEKMTIVKRLYTGVMPDKTASRLIKRIKKRKPCADVYVITLPLFVDGLLEVYEANEFLQPYYKKRTDDRYRWNVDDKGRSVFSYTGYYPGCIWYDRKV